MSSLSFKKCFYKFFNRDEINVFYGRENINAFSFNRESLSRTFHDVGYVFAKPKACHNMYCIQFCRGFHWHNGHAAVSLFFFRIFSFSLSSIYIRRKYWIRENFRHPVFNRFTCFGRSWTRFDHFLKMFVCLSVCMLVCMSPKFCGHCISRTNSWKLIKLYIQLHLQIVCGLLDFGAHHSRSSDVTRNFDFFNTVV